jgi:hypothetical protein
LYFIDASSTTRWQGYTRLIEPPHNPRSDCRETPRPGLLHGLGWELRQEDAMALFYRHSVTRKLVIWREPRYYPKKHQFFIQNVPRNESQTVAHLDEPTW